MRKLSMIDPEWWDFTTLDDAIINDAAKLTVEEVEQLSRPGFTVEMYDSREELFVAQALEYILAWKDSTPDSPSGVCGPIGPTEHLPLVAQMVNQLNINLENAYFWGMDEWAVNGQAVSSQHALSFAGANKRLLFDRIRSELRMPEGNIFYPNENNLKEFSESFDHIRCKVMQGGQGDAKHWAFNDPLRRSGQFRDQPPTPEQYKALGARHVGLHPLSMLQNSKACRGGLISAMPTEAFTVGPQETWKSDRVSIYHPGYHDNPLGMRLTAFMISKGLMDTSVPMSVLADHPNVVWHIYRHGMGTCQPQISWPLPIRGKV